jgi:ankyrin repeat protein
LQRTPLHLAAQRGDIQLAEVLLEYGADVDAKDSEPATVLDFAVAFNNSSFVAFLLERGVNETLILDRNKAKFKEMKRIIDFKNNLSKAPRKEHRKLSWGRGTRLAT